MIVATAMLFGCGCGEEQTLGSGVKGGKAETASCQGVVTEWDNQCVTALSLSVGASCTTWDAQQGLAVPNHPELGPLCQAGLSCAVAGQYRPKGAAVTTHGVVYQKLYKCVRLCQADALCFPYMCNKTMGYCWQECSHTFSNKCSVGYECVNYECVAKR